ncbi:MAG: hypothetical protein LBS10_11540 [Gracilibacteraceae bacterium]|jgi:2-iminobutanoate/2-iminopropanoate deaminase|nr:hypothetical protein [Gracilibacteraceae bacterium]
MTDRNTNKYLFFSATELLGFFHNNLRGKDIKTQTRRVLEMARIFLARQDFRLEDVYCVRVLLRDGGGSDEAAAALGLYFPPERCPVGTILAGGLAAETPADIEVDFSACRAPKTYVRAEEPVVRPPFAAAVAADGYVYCAGTRPAAGGDARTQAASCLASLAAILGRAGSGPADVYALTASLAEKDIPALAAALADWGGRADMVREADTISRPCGEYLMEIACSAELGRPERE